MKSNPEDTPHSREWRRLQKQGLTESEIAHAITEKWPDTRYVPFIIYDRGGRTAFTKFAKYLIKQGIVIDYEYQSKAEMKSETGGDEARGNIEVIGKDTPLPYDKLVEFADEVAGNYEVYDDDYTGEFGEGGRQVGRPKTNPGKLKAKLLR